MVAEYKTLDGVAVAGRRVLLRADLNVPVHGGRVTDLTRLERLSPSITELARKGARVVVLSHFGRPGGKPVSDMSLRPIAEALALILQQPVGFASDCVGPEAESAVAALGNGDVVVLENTRFHPGEEANDPRFASALAKLGDLYVNDAFSVAHRAHASTEAVGHLLPAYAGRLMEAELNALNAALGSPRRPVAAIVGGSKVSTKLDLLTNLITKVDLLVIGGAMANTFLGAQGIDVGKSLEEPSLHETARRIVISAGKQGCRILLPIDLVVSRVLAPNVPTQVVPVHEIPADTMALDLGPATTEAIIAVLREQKTVIWNGPVGAFETPPFNTATIRLAQAIAAATESGLTSVAGGGDTVAALHEADAIDRLTYVSTAGGAFLEWMEGKSLPGVRVLRKT